MSGNRGGITFEFVTKVPAVNRAVDAALRTALDRIGIRWQEVAKYAAPVDTGRLRASIAFSTPNVNAFHTESYKTGVVQYQPPAVQGLTVQVGSNVEYAMAVHEGLPSEMAIRRNNQTVRIQVTRDPNKFIEEPGRQHAAEFRGFVAEELAKLTGGTP